MMQDKSFDLYGSCVLYDTFRINNAENLINIFLFCCTPLYYLEQGIKIDKNDYMNYLLELPKHYIDYSNFRKKNQYIELTHSSLKILLETHSKYLLLDAVFSIDNHAIANNDITINIREKNIIKCLENHNIVKINKQGTIFDVFTKDEIKRRSKFFCDFLLKIYPPERIIFFRVNLSPWIYNRNDNTIASIYNEKYAAQACQIKFLEETMLENLPGCHVITLPEITIANKGYTWGEHPLHYVDETYIALYKALNDIVENNIDSIDLTETVSIDNCNIFNKCFKENTKIIDFYRRKYLFFVWKNVLSNLSSVLPDSIELPSLGFDYNKLYVQFFIKGHPHEVHYEILEKDQQFFVCVHCELKINPEKYKNIFKYIDEVLNTNSKKMYRIHIQSNIETLEKDLLDVIKKTLPFFLEQEQN